jgi:hypothetical protein
MQWHPIFVNLLRSLVQDHYEVQTNLPVGDLPREADIVLVRRISDQPPPFQTLLHYLTTWNVIEFKGRSVSARLRDLDLLVELGLGVDRKLNEERVRQEQEQLAPAEVSFWTIVNHLGQRFLDEARTILGGLEEASPGVWRSQILSRPVFLIDSVGVAVDRETVAIHLVGEESPEIEQELARVIVEEPGYWKVFGEFLRSMHPNIFEEATRMAPKEQSGEWNLRPFVDKLGVAKYLEPVKLEEMIDNAGPKKVIETLGMKKIVEEAGVENIFDTFSPEERKRFMELYLRGESSS